MAFELKSGNKTDYKNIGSTPESTHTMPDGTVHPEATHEEYAAKMGENGSPLPFLKGLRKGLKTAIQNNPISMGVRALKGEDPIRMDGEGGGDDCNCGETAAGEAIDEASSSEADTPQGIAKAKAQSLFGGSNWKKIKKGAAGTSGSGMMGGMA